MDIYSLLGETELKKSQHYHLIKIVVNASFVTIFSHSEVCLFTLLIVSFVVQKLLSLIRGKKSTKLSA